MSEFGYTNSDEVFAKTVAWRDAAIADGWELTPVYSTEPADSYGRLSKEGYCAHACCRITEEMKKRFPHIGGKWKYEAQISVWGPDGLCIRPPEIYNWSELTAGTQTCSSCGARNVETVRYAFAGRCCKACLPAMRAKHEQRGWCD